MNTITDIPFQKLDTLLTWKDVLLDTATKNQIGELLTWLKHNGRFKIEYARGKKFKTGYFALFYGPNSTDKTLTAALLGKYCKPKQDVYRIDLSKLVSKYIGETEKNLSILFDMAENRDWILFFDEADAIFGKRTQTKDIHDRYINQESSYLLQCIENYDGLAILSANFKGNMDAAFIRRLRSVIYFPLLTGEEKA